MYRGRSGSGYIPDNALSAGSYGFEVLVALKDGELGVSDLHSVEHGGESGGHLRAEERHATCFSHHLQPTTNVLG